MRKSVNRCRIVPRVDALESRQLLSATHAVHQAPLVQRADHSVPAAVGQFATTGSLFSTTSGLAISPSPTVNRSFLAATTAISDNDIWAVGFTDSGTLAEHFDGTSWSVVSTPTPAGSVGAQLLGVTAAASNDVWAVGENVSHNSSGNPVFTPLIEHIDGTRWSIVASPTLGTGGVLKSVTEIAPNNVWAVGSLGNGRGGNLIEHFDGKVWSAVSAPSLSSRDALLGISGTSGNDITAVGETGRFGTSEILHFDGTSWSAVTAPSTSSLTSVTALAANNVWATASNGGFEHFDGTSWSVVAGPKAGVLTGIAVVSANDIWAVGNFTDPSTGFERTLTEHYDGTSWSVVASPNATSGHNSLSGVTALADGTVVAVGTAGDQTTGNVNGLILKK